MLHISHSREGDVTTVLLEGRLMRDWIGELRAVIDTERQRGPIVLDLKQLTFADRAGLDLLRELTTDGVRLVGATAFVRGLLDA